MQLRKRLEGLVGYKIARRRGIGYLPEKQAIFADGGRPESYALLDTNSETNILPNDRHGDD